MVTNMRGDAKTGGSLGCNDCMPVEFTVLRNVGLVKSKIRPLNFRKTDFQLFKEKANRIPWQTALSDKGVQQSWQIFKEVFP